MSTDIQGSTGGGGGGGVQSTGAGASSAASFMGWGDGWRGELAKGSTDSEKELKRLERFESPEVIYKSFRSLENRMSSGEIRTMLPKGASPEETARWRGENGIPLKPEEYKVNMPAGKQPPAEDDAFLKSFLKSAHDANFTQVQVDQAVKEFYSEVDRQVEAYTAAEKKASEAAEDQLRKEWGSDYRTNKSMAEALLSRAPAGFREKFMTGYLGDKSPIRASVDAWKWLVQLEREINPAATVLPGATGDLGKGIAQELTELRKLMGDQRSAYWKGPEAEKMQARYRDLVDAEKKMQKAA